MDLQLLQGTVFEPLLFTFLLYFKDLPERTVRWLPFGRRLSHIKTNYNQGWYRYRMKGSGLFEWMGGGLEDGISPKICVVIEIINTRNPITQSAHYNLHVHLLDVVYSSKHFGVTITKDTRLDNHINNIASEADKTLEFLSRHKGTPYICKIWGTPGYSSNNL